MFTGRAITFGFGPSFSWNILNYGQITNTVRVQDAKLQGLLVDYQNTVLKAQKEVEDGLATIAIASQVEYLRHSVAAAESRARDRADLSTRSVPGISPRCLPPSRTCTRRRTISQSPRAMSRPDWPRCSALSAAVADPPGRRFRPRRRRADEMRARTDWGDCCRPPVKAAAGAGLPSPEESSVRPPEGEAAGMMRSM